MSHEVSRNHETVAPKGLTGREAAERLQKYGLNTVREERANPLLVFLGKFWAPVPWMLEATIFASDLLWKFNLLVGVRTQEPRKKSIWRFLFRQGSQKLSLQMKARVCPACDHVAEFEAFHLKDLLDSITEKEFLEAFIASQGICLPHLFLVEEKHSNHPNSPFLLQLQLDKSRSLRERLEEFIRKQDRRFQQEITADEAKAWRVAMEFLVGKPGISHK